MCRVFSEEFFGPHAVSSYFRFFKGHSKFVHLASDRCPMSFNFNALWRVRQPTLAEFYKTFSEGFLSRA